MPIAAHLRPLYGPQWRAISLGVRLAGTCEHCGARQGAPLHAAFDAHNDGPGGAAPASALPQASAPLALAPLPHPKAGGSPGKSPARARQMALPLLAPANPRRQVCLAAAHRNHNPADNRPANLAPLCQRCHLRHDAAAHAAARRRNRAGAYVPGVGYAGLGRLF